MTNPWHTRPIAIWRLIDARRQRQRPGLLLTHYARTVEEAIAWVQRHRHDRGRHVIGHRDAIPQLPRAPRWPNPPKWGTGR